MPDPYRSGVYWAASRARKHIKGFILGGVIFSVVAASVSSIIKEPRHPTPLDHVYNAGVGVLVALAFISFLAFVYAIIVAPYEQRNLLRRELSSSRDAIASLKSTKINVKFDPPRSTDAKVLIPFTNLGKTSEFVVYASNIKGRELGNIDPFPVAWNNSGLKNMRLQENAAQDLLLCLMKTFRFGKSRTVELSFVTSAEGKYRVINPHGTVTVDLEATDLTTAQTKRARVTLSFSEEHADWFKFENAQCDVLT